MSADSAPWRPERTDGSELRGWRRDCGEGSLWVSPNGTWVYRRPDGRPHAQNWQPSAVEAMEAADAWAHEEGLR